MNLKKIILIAFVLSGMAALIYEVTWTRPLQVIFGSTIYTVSIIFSAFMGGLALGSWIISKFVDRIKNLPSAYALMELGIGLYGVLLLIIFNSFPIAYRAIYPLYENFYLFEFLQFLLSFGVILIPTTLMGATFPIIAKFYTEQKVGKGIGEIYSANNIGAILGSFGAGFILIPILGIKYTIITAGLINIFVASLILFVSSRTFAIKIIPIFVIVFAALALVTNYNIQNLYQGNFQRVYIPEKLLKDTSILFYKEGLHATINVVDEKGSISLLINGYGQGSTIFEDLRVNFLLAYLPLLINPESEKALVIGLGTGTTSGQLNQFVKTKTVEIEPTVVEAAEYFWFLNLNVTQDPSHELILDDARNYLLRNNEKYDIIVSEPTNTWQSFSTSLFSKEFLELVKQDLNDSGLYLQWVPIYFFTPKDFRSFYHTFNSVFPYVVAFVNTKGEMLVPTTEILFVGSSDPINYKDIERNFKLLPPSSKEYLLKGEIVSGKLISALLLFTSEQMKGYGEEAPIVTDDNALLEFSTAKILPRFGSTAVIEDINKFLGEVGKRWLW